jgi:hypothetical protein
MRTKTMLLSALLGSLGSLSLMAQSTNVYSLNAVGYINVTLPPLWSIISCPLMASPDNTLNTLFTNSGGAFKKFQEWSWFPATGTYAEDIGTASGWLNGGTNTLNPGQAVWIYNPGTTTVTNTFVGTVPSGTLNNVLLPQTYNLMSSILPTSGDIVTNSLMLFTNATKKDQAWAYSSATQGFSESVSGGGSAWPNGGDPVQPIAGGFFYFNAGTVANTWVENFSVSQ